MKFTAVAAMATVYVVVQGTAETRADYKTFRQGSRSAMPGTVYRFERFSVDTSAHTLLRDGVRLSIQEQPFQVLLALLATPGQVVTREALRTRLWGTDTFVDFDQSLNSAVRRLRLALEDNSRQPIYIETLPRIGFRFLPEVSTESSGSVVAPVPHEAGSPVPSAPRVVQEPHPALREREAHRSPRLAAAGLLTLCLGFALGTAPARWRASHIAKGSEASHPTLDAFTGAAAPAANTADPDTRPALPLPEAHESDTPPVVAVDASFQELQGWYHLRRRNQEDLLTAQQDFVQTVAQRPGDASALVGLAQANILLALNGDSPRQRVEQARVAGERALALAPHLASAHAALGAAEALADWNAAKAGHEFQTALRLSPHDSLSHLWYAVFVLLPRADYRHAEAEANLALREDPLSLIAHTDLGWILYSAGKRKAALDQYRFVLQLDPGFVPAQFRIRQAAAEGHDAGLQALVARQQAMASTAARLRKTGASVVEQTASPCAGAAGPRPSLPAVKMAVEAHCPSAYFFGQNPELAGLRDDPGFTALLKMAHPAAGSR